MGPISSARNPLVKRIRLLADRRHRRREGACVVRGIQPVWQAVAAGAEIEAMVIAPELLRSPPARRMVEEQRARGVRVVELTAELFGRIADRDGPTGLAAIVRTQVPPLDRLAAECGVYLALHEIGNPGNLGTILRTADAVGDAGVVLVGATTDPFDPAAVKASMGAVFHVPLAHAATVDDFFDWAQRRGVAVATTSARAPEPFWQVTYPRPVAILLGSEGTGLPPEVLARGDLRLRIPMAGHSQSLNLAVATGLLLYEVRRTAVADRADGQRLPRPAAGWETEPAGAGLAGDTGPGPAGA